MKMKKVKVKELPDIMYLVALVVGVMLMILLTCTAWASSRWGATIGVPIGVVMALGVWFLIFKVSTRI